MGITIHLGYNKGYTWINAGNVFFTGYIIGAKKLVPSAHEIRSLFSNITDYNSFKSVVKDLNGVFSIIIKERDCLYAATDPTRFFPLFYCLTAKGDFYISDDITFIVKETHSSHLNSLAVREYLSAAYTCDNRTLFNDIFQVRPGEAIKYNPNTLDACYYYNFSSRKKDQISKTELAYQSELKNVIDSVFNSLLLPLKDNKIALPLSGGYDSRLIACKLKEFGFDNVVCFTYGQNNPEVDISKKVAHRLGFDWYFIEYNDKLVKNFNTDRLFSEYYEYASRGTSMFYLQEYPAIRYLIENKIIGTDFISLPGHSGGLLRGSFLKKYYPVDIDLNHAPDLLLRLRHIHCHLPAKEKKQIKEGIKKHIAELMLNNELLPYSVLEDWELKERTSKYIFNSSHAFTFFGLKTCFPLADKRLFEFFRTLPSEYRLYGKLFYQVVRNTYFKPFEVDFGEELKPKPVDIMKARIKARIRPFLPLIVKNYYLRKNDWPFYGPMTQYLLDELNDQNIYPVSNGSAYLYRILNWYLMKIK